MAKFYVRRCRLSATGMNHIRDGYAVCDEDDPRRRGEVQVADGVRLADFTTFYPPDTLWISDPEVDGAVRVYGEVDADA